MLDLDGKGFVSSSDVAKLLDNENISDNDILLLFRRLNSSEETLDRLTYLGYFADHAVISA